MKRFILTLLGLALATGAFAQPKPHSVPETEWKQLGYTQEADTTTENTDDKFWMVYGTHVKMTNWFRNSEYSGLYYHVYDSCGASDTRFDSIAVTGTLYSTAKVVDANGQWNVDWDLVKTELTVTVTDTGKGTVNFTGSYTLMTGPWYCWRWHGTSAANDSTIIKNVYDGYDVKGK